ncbi:MAG: GTPase [Planctomycetia bacterium]
MTHRLAHPSELIVAPATVPGSGARAIVRLSGEGLTALLEHLVVAEPPESFTAGGLPRCVAARLHPALAATWGPLEIDVLWWPGPAGPTGGPLAELQLPASVPLVDALVAAACRQGARLARGGEFSLRSFLAGRIDLVQAEAVLAVVDARTPAELMIALDRMAGGAGRRLHAVREQLLDMLADIEAVIDFSDEHAPDHVAAADAAFWQAVDGRLATALRTLDEVAAHVTARDAVAGDLPRVVLVGRPNIGKSSLFNALAGGSEALVADEVGTTRDWIAARLDAEGTAAVLVDLAGIDGGDAIGPVAAAAIRAAEAEVARADVLLVCRDASDPGDVPAIPAGRERIDVLTRCDLGAVGSACAGAMLTSSHERLGIDDVRRAIIAAVQRLAPRGPTATLRMRVGVEEARAEILRAQAFAGTAGRDEALVAGHLGRAVAAIGTITGRDMGDDLLDRIFERHCIGK